jgi:sterol 3beta-glucosyltransferase
MSMRILILTYGTRGDVQPYVALGIGLAAAGHAVTIATAKRFREFVEGHGLAFFPMADDLLALLDTQQGRDLLENTDNFLQVLKQNVRLAKQMKPIQQGLLDDSRAAADAVAPDFIVYHPKTFAGPHIAEKRGIKCVLATPIPLYVPTSERPFLALPNFGLGGWYNRLGYRIVALMTGLFVGGYIRDLRGDLGLPRQKRSEFLKTGDGSAIPVLHAFSQAVMPRPRDWPDSAHVTGYWFLDEGRDWSPSDELAAFLEAGPPPVYVGFGSMAGSKPERLAGIVIEALQKAGLRGILAAGWGGLRAGDVPDTILKIDHAPHDWLFPRMAAVVHHGGAGTTGAGLRAGKPSLIVPFFGDQPFWGRLVHEIGAGPKPVPQKKLTADLLADRLTEAVSDKAMIDTADRIGRKIRAEDGVGAAMKLIGDFANDRSGAIRS